MASISEFKKNIVRDAAAKLLRRRPANDAEALHVFENFRNVVRFIKDKGIEDPDDLDLGPWLQEATQQEWKAKVAAEQAEIDRILAAQPAAIENAVERTMPIYDADDFEDEYAEAEAEDEEEEDEDATAAVIPKPGKAPLPPLRNSFKTKVLFWEALVRHGQEYPEDPWAAQRGQQAQQWLDNQEAHKAKKKERKKKKKEERRKLG